MRFLFFITEDSSSLQLCDKGQPQAMREIEFRAETVYSCKECNEMFLFVGDVSDHSKMFGHSIDELPLG